MNKNLEKQIRKKLVQFLTGKMSLREFNRWFVPAVWDVNDPSTILGGFVYGVKHLLDHRSYGLFLSEEELKGKLQELLNGFGWTESKVVELDEFIFHLHIEPTETGALSSFSMVAQVITNPADPGTPPEVFNHLVPLRPGTDQSFAPQSRTAPESPADRQGTPPYRKALLALQKS